MKLWAVIWVRFGEWPMILELHEHRTVAGARARDDAAGHPEYLSHSNCTACMPIKTGADIQKQLNKLYLESQEEIKKMPEVTIFEWSAER